MLNYIGNAQIIELSELPRIGEAHKIRKSVICIEVKIIDFIDNHIIYQAKFCEKTSICILDDFYINCCSWLYAVKNTEKEAREKEIEQYINEGV